MEELLRKIIENSVNPKAVDLSEDGIRKAAKELGYSDEEITKLFATVKGIPLDENMLNGISGGAFSRRLEKPTLL